MVKAKSAEAPCPLFLHRGSGQWAKKIDGKTRYFGKDRDSAVTKWKREDRDRKKGIQPARYQAGHGVAALGNVYADYLRRQVSNSELDGRTASEYERSIRRLVDIVGAECKLASLEPADFGRIKEALFEPVAVGEKSKRYGGRTVKRRAITTVSGDIRNLRVFFNWCAEQKYIPKPEYGSEFSTVTRKALRRKRTKEGPKDLPADAIRAIIASSRPAMRAMTLLGINAGVGNLDIADMKLSDLPKLKGEVWVDLPRGKTGAQRRFVLWPETVEALKTYLTYRPSPAGASNRERLFLTKNGLAWVRQDKNLRTDSIGTEFAKARKAAGLERGSFYDLRRTFRTRAAGTRDREAVDSVMGHVEEPDDMGAVYNQWIDDDRIRAVVMHVRQWLYPEVTK